MASSNHAIGIKSADIKENTTITIDEPTESDIQTGVQKIEGITSVWSKRALILAYALIYLVFFVMLVQQSTLGTLTPFVTSSFQQHSLTPTVSIVSSIIGGVFKLTLAKTLDVFGRPQGLLLSVVIATLGLVMMAATNGVRVYAAAQVLYTVGQNAVFYTTSIFVADTSSLRNRMLMTTFTASPAIASAFLGGPISEAFLEGPGWPWAFGTFAIIVPVTCAPLVFQFLYYERKAVKGGVVAEKESRAPWESLVYYLREFDVFGLLLLSAGLALFLLPFNFYALQGQGWKSALIICLIIFGFLLIMAFVVWERSFAPVTFIPFSLLQDRAILGASILGACLFVSSFCWSSFFSSFLMVVFNLSVTKASYIANASTAVSTVCAVATGAYIRYTGRFKNITLLAVPLYVLAVGLMIHFRHASADVGLVVMCQVLASIGGGVITTTPAIAAMSSASHQHIAVVMAVVNMVSEIGGAIGLTVSGAIWSSIFPSSLARNLPEEDLPNLLYIYADINTQLSYPVGSPGRIAIQQAYSDAQRMMLIAGTAIWALGMAAVFMWRNLNVKGVKQVKGTVV